MTRRTARPSKQLFSSRGHDRCAYEVPYSALRSPQLLSTAAGSQASTRIHLSRAAAAASPLAASTLRSPSFQPWSFRQAAPCLKAAAPPSSDHEVMAVTFGHVARLCTHLRTSSSPTQDFRRREMRTSSQRRPRSHVAGRRSSILRGTCAHTLFSSSSSFPPRLQGTWQKG